MRRALVLTAVSIVATAPGCGTQAAPGDTVVPAVAPVATGPMFDDLEYANWSRFPVGTTAVRKSLTTADGATASVTTVETYTLLKVGADEVTVSRQNTTTRSDGSLNQVNGAEPRTHRRQFAIPAGMSVADFDKPSRSAKKVGEEEVSAAGKKYKATVYGWTDQSEGGPMNIKVWLSDEVPGRVIRQEVKLPKTTKSVTEELVEVKTP